MSNPALLRRVGAVVIAAVIIVVGVRADDGSAHVAVATASTPGHRSKVARVAPVAPVAPIVAPAPVAPANVAPVTTAASPTTTAPVPAPVPVALPLVVPTGKGMWIYQPEFAEGGDPNAIVARAL